MDLQTRRAQAADDRARAAISGRRGRPTASGSRSRPIAAARLPFAHGRWEHLQLADVYVDSSRRHRTEADHRARQLLRQPEVVGRQPPRRSRTAWTPSETLRDPASPSPRRPGNDTRLVSIDVATGAADRRAGRPRREDSTRRSCRRTTSATSARTRPTPASTTRAARRARRATSARAAWSPDGSRVVFHKRLTAPPTTWRKTLQPAMPQYELTLDGDPAVVQPAGDRFVMTRPADHAASLGAQPAGRIARGDEQGRRRCIRTRSATSSRRSWSPSGDQIIFGIGVFNAVLQRLQRPRSSKPGDRVEGGAQIAIINADGTGFREVTTGAEQQRLPVDGARRQARSSTASFGPDGEGLRIMNIETKAVTTLTKGYDNFPLWSPRGDLIMFSRAGEGRLRDLHDQAGRHRREAPDVLDAATTRTRAGRPTASTSCSPAARMGFKDEVHVHRTRRSRTASCS